MLGALAHDLYLFYQNPDKGFEFSAIGFIWTKYEPESYLSVSQSLDSDTWELVDYLLTFSAFYVGLGIAITGYVFIGLIALFMHSRKQEASAAAAVQKWKRRG